MWELFALSELIQIEKTRDLHPEFITEWTAIIEQYLSTEYDVWNFLDKHFAEIQRQTGLDWHDHKLCFVGEAHGFRDQCACSVCFNFAIDHRPRDSKKGFYEFKNDLYNHMKEVHWK